MVFEFILDFTQLERSCLLLSIEIKQPKLRSVPIKGINYWLSFSLDSRVATAGIAATGILFGGIVLQFRNGKFQISYLEEHSLLEIMHFLVFSYQFLAQLLDFFTHSLLTVLQMSDAVMELLVLAFVSASASATTHNVLFAQCIDMYQVVLLLNQTLAELATQLHLLAIHPMRLHPRPLHPFPAVFALNRHQFATFLMLQHFSLYRVYFAALNPTCATQHFILALLFMLLDSFVWHLLSTAILPEPASQY